jgi:hypothetical protein
LNIYTNLYASFDFLAFLTFLHGSVFVYKQLKLHGRTSVKIGLYNNNRCKPAGDEPDRNEPGARDPASDEPGRDEPYPQDPARDERPSVDPKVKSLIQSVAFEIQKSFSQRNLHKVAKTTLYQHRWNS